MGFTPTVQHIPNIVRLNHGHPPLRDGRPCPRLTTSARSGKEGGPESRFWLGPPARTRQAGATCSEARMKAVWPADAALPGALGSVLPLFICEKFGDRSARSFKGAAARGWERRGSGASRFMRGLCECPPSLQGRPGGQDAATGDGRPAAPPGPPAPGPEAARNPPLCPRPRAPRGPSGTGTPGTPPDWGSPCILSTIAAPRGSPARPGLLADLPPDRGSP